MKLSELEKLLTSSGYSLGRCNKHRIWVRTNSNPIAVPNHRLVNKMVARKILKEIGYAQV